MKISFRKRTKTEYIYINTLNTECRSVGEYFNLCRCKGELDTGYHYFITKDGFIETDREEDAIAGWHLNDNENSIYILVNGDTCSDAQNASLKALLITLQAKYPQALTKE